MKRNIFITLIFTSIALFSFGQTFEIQATEGDEGYLYIQMQETSGTGTPQTTNYLSDIVFQIKWLQSLGDVDMGSVICTNYEITKSGSRTSSGLYYYQEYYADNTSFLFPENWTQGTWVTIAKIEVGTGTGSGTFEVGDNSFVDTGVNIGVDLTDYTPTVNGSAADYSYPTIVYDLVWTGATDGYWDKSSNWSSACGGAGSIPNIGNNCLIPVVATNYPSLFFAVSFSNQPTCDYLRVNTGASILLEDLDALSTQLTYTVNNDMAVYGTLTIQADAQITVSGSTYIDAAEGLVVQATSAGSGSFIDNGTITYGGSGTAKVQTYLTGSGVANTFDLHLIGPTVDYGSGGALLSVFNIVDGETYAYEYDEPNDTWQNITSLTALVPTTKGIGLSTNDGSTNTMEMTGELITGDLSSATMTFGGGGNYLLSNPYPSSIFWDDLETTNTGNVNDKVYVYDGSAYQDYNTTSGGTNGFTGYLQVGQGFFVEAVSNTTFDFLHADRSHSNATFYSPLELFTNRLDVRVEGNDRSDGLLVHFYNGSLEGYDANEDVEKMMSDNENATQIWTNINDGMNMSINAMPEELLQGEMFSVPLSFKCTTTTDYTLTFNDIESFELETEVYLEDTQTGENWVYLNDNPIYTFNAAAQQSPDRFIIHFFGPTDIEEVSTETVNIYSSGQYAYVRNNTQENIKMIYIYNLSGELVLSKKNADNLNFNKFWVSDQIGYYVVRVLTDTNIYTEKVLIFK